MRMLKNASMLLFTVFLLRGLAIGKVGAFNLNLPDYAVVDRISLVELAPANSKYVVAELEGPGCINHIWMTIAPRQTVHPRFGVVGQPLPSQMLNRETIIRIYFDDSSTPHVETPIGDFFGVMHGEDSYPINTEYLSVLPWSGYNCYFQMPFAKKARVEFKTGNQPFRFYIQIDWHLYPDQEMKEKRRFCAAWRRENPTQRYGEDFFMLDVDKPGQLIGFVYGVRLFDNEDRWSHGGAENIYIDGLGRHPAFIRGIGGEDTFGTSFGGAVHDPSTHLYASQPFYIHQDIGEARPAQRLVGYRFYVKDSIRWHDSLHMRFGTMKNDICSTVYWYQEGSVQSGIKLPKFSLLIPDTPLSREDTMTELPYSGSWKVGGPFDNRNNSGIKKALDGTLLTNISEQIEWVPDRRAYHGFIDFNHLWRPHRRGVGIHYRDNVSVAQAILTVDCDTTASIRVAWDDHLVMQINGDRPIDMGSHVMFRQKTIKVPFKKGDNFITLTLSNTTGLNQGGWAFAFKAIDEENNIIVPQSSI